MAIIALLSSCGMTHLTQNTAQVKKEIEFSHSINDTIKSVSVNDVKTGIKTTDVIYLRPDTGEIKKDTVIKTNILYRAYKVEHIVYKIKDSLVHQHDTLYVHIQDHNSNKIDSTNHQKIKISDHTLGAQLKDIPWYIWILAAIVLWLLFKK